jgi:hypothetical protein
MDRGRGDAATESVASESDPTNELRQTVAESEADFPGVRRDYLSLVRDDTVLQPRESDAWYHLFDLLTRTDKSKLQKNSIGQVTHVQLYNQPSAYRGWLVTISGRLRGAERLEATQNAFGVKEYFKLWIEMGNGANPPIAIAYVLELPEGLATGADMSEQVDLTGFHFKRLAYKAQDDIRLAPLIAAKTLDWTPQSMDAPTSEEQAEPKGARGEIIRSTIIAIVLLGIVWFAIRRTVIKRTGTTSRRGFVYGSSGAPKSTGDPATFLSELAERPIEQSTPGRSQVDPFTSEQR